MRLGAALRESHVWTQIRNGEQYYGAVAWTFLGSKRRSVEGSYSIHPMPTDPTAAAKAPMADDFLRAISAATVAYATEVTGTEHLSTYALGPRPAGNPVLTNLQLVPIGVTTEAARRTQYGTPTVDCRTPRLTDVRQIVCENPGMAAQDRRIQERLQDLPKLAPDLVPVDEQQRWQRHQDPRQNANMKNAKNGICW